MEEASWLASLTPSFLPSFERSSVRLSSQLPYALGIQLETMNINVSVTVSVAVDHDDRYGAQPRGSPSKLSPLPSIPPSLPSTSLSKSLPETPSTSQSTPRSPPRSPTLNTTRYMQHIPRVSSPLASTGSPFNHAVFSSLSSSSISGHGSGSSMSNAMADSGWVSVSERVPMQTAWCFAPVPRDARFYYFGSPGVKDRGRKRTKGLGKLVRRCRTRREETDKGNSKTRQDRTPTTRQVNSEVSQANDAELQREREEWAKRWKARQEDRERETSWGGGSHITLAQLLQQLDQEGEDDEEDDESDETISNELFYDVETDEDQDEQEDDDGDQGWKCRSLVELACSAWCFPQSLRSALRKVPPTPPDKSPRHMPIRQLPQLPLIPRSPSLTFLPHESNDQDHERDTPPTVPMNMPSMKTTTSRRSQIPESLKSLVEQPLSPEEYHSYFLNLYLSERPELQPPRPLSPVPPPVSP